MPCLGHCSSFELSQLFIFMDEFHCVELLQPHGQPTSEILYIFRECQVTDLFHKLCIPCGMPQFSVSLEKPRGKQDKQRIQDVPRLITPSS